MPIYSFSNEMFVVFKSKTGGKKGFLATHSTVCGGRIQASGKTKLLYSHPNFGKGPYENRMYCDWIIEAPIGYNVKIKFVSFKLEEHKYCLYDWVEIIGDLNYSDFLLGKYCGSEIPEEVTSEDRALKVRFKTDDDGTSDGFVIQYQAVEEPYYSSEEDT